MNGLRELVQTDMCVIIQRMSFETAKFACQQTEMYASQLISKIYLMRLTVKI